MNLLQKGTYTLHYFNKIHIQALLFFIIVGIIIIGLPFIFKNLEKTKYTTILGYLMIFSKLLDILYRTFGEKHPFIQTLPLNLCNVAVIIAGIYYIKRDNRLFNILYFWFSGAIMAVLLPDLGVTYARHIYMYIFLFTHTIEVIAVLYAFIHLDPEINKDGLILSIKVYMGLLTLCVIMNYIFNTNFMFANSYIIPAVSIIKPFILYQVLFHSLFIFSMYIMYLPFAKNVNDEIEEIIITK